MQPSNYPKHKFSAYARKRLKKLPEVSLRTTLLTSDGPAVGTIWHDVDTGSTYTVERVEERTVHYDDGGWDHRGGFNDAVDEGRYILVGVSHPVETYIPHIIA